MGKLGKEIYSGAAEWGRFRALLGAIISTIIGLVLFGVGIYYMTKHTDYTQKVQATFGAGASDDCQPSQSDTKWHCSELPISYSYGGKTYNKIVYEAFDILPVEGQLVDIWINPNHPDSFTFENNNTKALGITLLIVGLVLVAIGWITYAIIRRFKFAAAASGVMSFWPKK